MDHLTTVEERRERWYATHLLPRYINVVRLQVDDHLFCPGSPKLKSPSSLASTRHIDCLDLDEGRIIGLPASIFLDDSVKSRQGALLLRENMEKNGFVVVTGVLTPDECNKALELAWDYLEGASCAERCIQQPASANDEDASTPMESCPPPVRRDDLATLSSAFFPASVEGGILPFYGSGHTTFAWFLRSNAVVRSVFAALYSVPPQELIASLDGVVLWRGGDRHRTDAGWFHVDQNPRTKPGFAAVQGLVNLLPVTPATGGNVLLAKSHTLFPAHFTSDGGGEGAGAGVRDFYRARLDEVAGDDWLEIDPGDARLLEPRRAVTCLLGPGDLLLWDSRVAHCSCPGRGMPTSRMGLIRAAGLVAMMPRKDVPDEVIRERIAAVRASRTLTHWANKATPLGEERSDEVALEMRRVEFLRKIRQDVLMGWDDLSDMQRALIG